MEITTNSNIYTAITSLQTSSKAKSETDSSFTISQNEKTQASDYTYAEYKKLSVKDINEIFPWDKMPHENEKAHKLQLLSTLSPDETLNQVLFDQAKNADFNDISTRNFFDRTLKTAETEKALISGNEFTQSEEFKLGIIGMVQTLPSDERDKFLKEQGFDSFGEYSEYIKNAKITVDPLDKEIDGIVDAKTYFKFYETSKNYFKEYGKDLSEYSQKYLPNEFALFDNVKNEYEKRVSQNDTMLNQLTYNSKPNPLEINI